MSSSASTVMQDWEEILGQRLRLFGHRNWIVVADSAYPAQSNAGIETIATGADHIEVLGKTLKKIAACQHIRVNILMDAELRFVSDEDAPGVTALRHNLRELLGESNARELDHEQIISKLDRSGTLFQVLVLKSTLSIPYSSVFLELDCGYWNSDSEARLRSSLKQASETTDIKERSGRSVEWPKFSGPFTRAT